MKRQYDLPCNIAQTLNIIGDKWTLLILHAIRVGHDTYREMQISLEGIPTNMLSNRIKALEEDGLIKAVLYQDHPPRYRYELCESGKDLDDVFYSLILWGEKHLDTCYKKVIHKDSEHSVEIRYYCKECDTYFKTEEVCVKELEEQ